ncbi:hypothetical protein SAMN04489712_10659 [Thermomonospora echinospora]|uniref:Lipoprotein n=1 Tax=Thermomonospora echinospora TaxID=1992 RepID=A0A1H6AWU3_9ACTN|nr:hypothetical protein SAMN04489712_10659 [Thermomonospora echinospora]
MLAALCALALAACGTDWANGKDQKTGPHDQGEVASAAPSPTEAEESEGPEFLAFMELLSSLAEPCLKDLPAPEPPKEPGPARPPTAPLPELTVPDGPPSPGKPRDRQTAMKEVELSSAEKCEARIHARRITKALKSAPGPTSQHVEKILRSLGYIDERLHGPQPSGQSVVFTLDLRVLGGRLCLFGNVTGTKTHIEPYGVSPEVGCLDVQRRH